VGLCLQSGYALPASQAHRTVSSRLTRNLILFVALQRPYRNEPDAFDFDELFDPDEAA